MNRTVGSDILFVSPIGRQITELRKVGNRLILYTESNDVYKQFKEWKQLIQHVPYLQVRSLVGVDLYFPKSELKGLLGSLRKIYGRTPKEKGFVR